MADITEIRELARKLNLWNIARGYIDLNDEKLSNLDYLQMILHKELEIRARQKQIKLRRVFLASIDPSSAELNFSSTPFPLLGFHG